MKMISDVLSQVLMFLNMNMSKTVYELGFKQDKY